MCCAITAFPSAEGGMPAGKSVHKPRVKKSTKFTEYHACKDSTSTPCHDTGILFVSEGLVRIQN